MTYLFPLLITGFMLRAVLAVVGLAVWLLCLVFLGLLHVNSAGRSACVGSGSFDCHVCRQTACQLQARWIISPPACYLVVLCSIVSSLTVPLSSASLLLASCSRIYFCDTLLVAGSPADVLGDELMFAWVVCDVLGLVLLFDFFSTLPGHHSYMIPSQLKTATLCISMMENIRPC